MKVKKLIEELKKCDPNADVKMNSIMGESVIFCCSIKGNPGQSVWLEGKSDTDLKAQLKALITVTEEEEWDEFDYYSTLSDHGITVEDVTDCLGDAAGEAYKNFAATHGI